jgi:AraC-like DNA-binding protein
MLSASCVAVDALTPIAATEAQHSVPGAQVLQLVELLEFWRIEPAEALAGTGLAARMLEEPNVRVPIETFNRIVARARKLTGEPGLGIFLGMRRRISMYGFLGFAVMHASSLREALELGVRFSSTITTAVKLSLHVEDEVAALCIEERFDPGECRDVAQFALMVGLAQIGRSLTGRELLGEVHFSMPRPAYFDRFTELVPNARFDRPVTQCVFDAKYLDLPLVAPDRAGVRLAREQCERALRDLGLDGGIVDRVRSLVGQRDGVRSLEEVAAELHMSPRTLKRRLAAQGLSFSELLEQERSQRARLLLHSSQLSLIEITERLGYSTVPNFARAFRRWTGQTPAAYRRAANSSPNLKRVAPANALRVEPLAQ